MVLSKEDSDLFYELWMPLLQFVNQKYQVVPELADMVNGGPMDVSLIKLVVDRLWEERELIDEYLESNKELSEEKREIVRGWKRAVKGTFFLERHLKSGSMLISADDETVYQSVGIKSSWEELLWIQDPPVVLDATLIPFKNVIIPDGIIMPKRIMFGGNMKKSLKDTYMRAKKQGLIRKTL